MTTQNSVETSKLGNVVEHASWHESKMQKPVTINSVQKRSSTSNSNSNNSSSRKSSVSTTTNMKTNCVQLHRPIYIACCRNEITDPLSYDEGDEFELLTEMNSDYLHVMHLRTNTECKLPRTRLNLDPNTPLRLGTDDRGVIQRCLLQFNVPGGYLIRRSKNERRAFVLSISQVANQRNCDDWHYLIRIHPSNNCFYFAQEPHLDGLFFPTFGLLINDVQVLKIIPLTTPLPFKIDFEEDLWHIPMRTLNFDKLIGRGEFGDVWRAHWQNGTRSIPVAVKKLQRRQQAKLTADNFAREIEAMKALRNNYIVALYGVAQDLHTNETLLVTELMENGDLKTWLKSRENVPEESTVIAFALDISRGMDFLEQTSHVHRDLACRNLLLGTVGNMIKIADFGLSTIVNENDFERGNEAALQRLPTRWTAPEVLKDNKAYSSKSDMWSFGIVLIEIWLKGDEPYPQETELSSVRAMVQSGYVHEQPPHCPNRFYTEVIRLCLAFKPDERPMFQKWIELFQQWNGKDSRRTRIEDENKPVYY